MSAQAFYFSWGDIVAKRKKVITAGNLVKTIIYTAPQPRDSEHVRAAKSKMTTAAQRALNYRTAQGKLEMILAANFGPYDLFCTLTYRDGCLPTNLADAKKCVRAFIKLLRKQRKRLGLPLKYVYVTEGKHGDKRYHHHLVINGTGPADLEMICSLWQYGDMVDVERIADHQYIEVARYITKENAEDKPNGAQMWTPSRNLVPPKVESYFVPDDETTQPPPGAYVLEREERQNEFGSFSYLKYRLPRERAAFFPRPQYKRKRPLKIE